MCSAFVVDAGTVVRAMADAATADAVARCSTTPPRSPPMTTGGSTDAAIDAPGATDAIGPDAARRALHRRRCDVDAAAADAAAALQLIAILNVRGPSVCGVALQDGRRADGLLVVANPNSGPGAAGDARYNAKDHHRSRRRQRSRLHPHVLGARPSPIVGADIDACRPVLPCDRRDLLDETATAATNVTSYYAPLYTYVKPRRPANGSSSSIRTAGRVVQDGLDIVLSFEDGRQLRTRRRPPG